ncbi:hypothetical protein O3M35_011065 [Rhynocoris fuscipes]|uniref:Uncharacterized protein n=1 Tax=Rhynocoris fuscipes TaxID=488301 RepID=A0AAW1CGL1_9HEMI
MKEIIIKCFLITCCWILIKAYAVNETIIIQPDQSQSNITNVTTITVQDDISNNNEKTENYSQVTNNTSFGGFQIPCYLWKVDDNGTLLIVNKSRAEVGEDKYLGYEESCYLLTHVRKLQQNTINSLAKK